MGEGGSYDSSPGTLTISKVIVLVSNNVFTKTGKMFFFPRY